jgi:CheY-like chemotaxis protein/Sec-independent protein translocase protein TatA
MVIQVELGIIVILLIIVIIGLNELPHRGLLEVIRDYLGPIKSAAERWDQRQREQLDFPETKPTVEQQQERDESEQQQLRRRAEVECGGWQTGQILCRRKSAEMFGCEYVLSTLDRTYTARGNLESFYRDGKSYIVQTPQLDAEVRYALPRALGKGLGLLLVENPGGRILSVQLIEERITPSVLDPEEEVRLREAVIKTNKQRAKRILVVNDEDSMRKTVSMMLTSSGYQCLAVEGGYEALALLEAGEDFDLLVTDLLNSPMDGLTLIERSKERLPNMPVVVASAVRDDAVIQACIRSGAFEYLFLPFETEQLLAIVSRALDNRS